MTDLERAVQQVAALMATVSYSVSFDGEVLFCRLCGAITWEPENVAKTFCPRCILYHDNRFLEEALREAGDNPGKPFGPGPGEQ